MGNCGPGVPAAKDGTNATLRQRPSLAGVVLICLLYVSKHLPDYIENFSNFGAAYEGPMPPGADEGPAAAPCDGFSWRVISRSRAASGRNPAVMPPRISGLLSNTSISTRAHRRFVGAVTLFCSHQKLRKMSFVAVKRIRQTPQWGSELFV